MRTQTCTRTYHALSSRSSRVHAARLVTATARSQTRLRANRHTGIACVLDLSQDQWEEEVLKADVPVLVDFWATWCGPCKLVAPTMDWAEKEYGSNLKVFKVEADPNQKLIEQYKVYGLPTLLLFKNGEEITRIEGAIPKKAVVDMLNKAGIEVAATA